MTKGRRKRDYHRYQFDQEDNVAKYFHLMDDGACSAKVSELENGTEINSWRNAGLSSSREEDIEQTKERNRELKETIQITDQGPVDVILQVQEITRNHLEVDITLQQVQEPGRNQRVKKKKNKRCLFTVFKN